MGTKKTESESKTTIAKRSRTENDALATLQRMMSGAEGQMGDLSGLASGEISASPEDLQYLTQIVAAQREMAERSAQEAFDTSSSMVDEDAAARGISGSSMEAVQRAIGGRAYQHTMANAASQGSQTFAEGALNLPFQRVGAQLSANDLLLRRLTGGAGGLLGHNLQERLAQAKTKGTQTQSGFGVGDIMGFGQQVGGLIPSGPTVTATSGGPVPQR